MDEIIRNDDGSLVVPVAPERASATDDAEGDGAVTEPAPPTSRVLHPGEGGFDEALAEWDAQQHPDREVAVSTASGREQAMHVVHELAESDKHDDHDVAAAVDQLDDPEASGEALRHVLVGGTPSVQGFAAEVADAEGGDPLSPHEATKIIGEVLAEIDT